MISITKIVVKPKSLADLPSEMSETPFVLVQPASASRLRGGKSSYPLARGIPYQILVHHIHRPCTLPEYVSGDKKATTIRL